MMWRNLIRRRGRTILTLLGIAIGVAAVVSLGAMAEGIINNYVGLVSQSDADLVVMQKGALDVSLSSLDEDIGERLLAIPDIERVDPGVLAYISTEGLPFMLLQGFEPHSPPMDHFKIVEGEPVRGPKQIIIGKQAAAALKKGVGDTLRIYGAPYRIVGIYETGQAMEESGGVITLEDAQSIAQKEHQVSMFQVRLRPQSLGRADAVIERIERIVPDVTVSKSADYGAQAEWVNMTRGFAWGVAFLAIVVGGLGMMNTMVMTVYERTREIGTLRAIGWRQRQVMLMILGEALVLSTLGGALGLALGVAMSWAVSTIPGLGSILAGQFTPQIFMQGMITAWVLGLVGGLYPAWRGARLQPIEALRYEGGTASSDLGAGRLARLLQLLPATARNLARRKTRTLLTSLGIGVGVASLVALGAITKGLMVQFNETMGSRGTGDVTVMQADIPDMSLSAIDERVARVIAAMPEVESVSSMVLGFVMTSDLPLFIITGLDLNSPAMHHYEIVEGQPIRRPNEIIVGRTAADNYKLKVGQSIELYDNRYRIVGIYETGVPWEESGCVMEIREAQSLLNKPRQVSFILVNVKDRKDAERVRDLIAARFPGLKASLSSEFAENTQDFQQTEAMAQGIIALTVFIGGIVVTNTMIMTVLERTREIGTLRALGWRQRQILRTIVTESAVLGLFSAVLGILIGVGLTEFLGALPVASGFVQGVYEPQLFIQAIVLALVLGILGGLYPAWRATRLSPVEALRYE